MTYKVITLDTTGTDVYGIFKYCNGSINYDTYYRFLEEYNKIEPTDTLAINITTLDGTLSYILMICNIICNHEGKTIARVSKCAMNGGALIALMCDEIHMDANGCLGSFDPYISSYMFYAPVHKMLSAFDRHRDTNWICDIGYTVSQEMASGFEDQVRAILSRKYTIEQVAEIMDVFYFNAHRNSPIFILQFPRCIIYKVVAAKNLNADREDGEQQTMSLFSQYIKKKMSNRQDDKQSE